MNDQSNPQSVFKPQPMVVFGVFRDSHNHLEALFHNQGEALALAQELERAYINAGYDDVEVSVAPVFIR
jgi:hypothetical protein